MAAMDKLLYSSPSRSQIPETTAWASVENASPGLNSPSAGDTSTSVHQDNTTLQEELSTGIYSSGTSCSTPTSPSLGDSSPELEIMAVRRIKKAAQAAAMSKKSKPQSIIQPDNTKSAQIPLPKAESFDMSLVDPALRGVGTSSSQDSKSDDVNRGSPITGIKRMVESDIDVPNKRLKEDEQSTPFLHPVTPIKSDSADTLDDMQPNSKPFATPQASLPPIHWLPNTWSKHDYLSLASAIDRSFNYSAYARHIGRHPAEIADVFRGIVMMPILDVVDRQFPTQIKNPDQAEALMLTYKQNESKLASIIADEDEEKLKSLKALALAEVGRELRIQIEDELRAQLKAEGWVQLNKAKDLIAGYEREIAETKSDAELDKKGKPRVKSMADAQRDLLAASIMFEKARKTEERKQRVAEREAKGENSKKMGRPKKGDGKGKTPDFV